MNKEILDTLNELTKKPITDLALSYMEVVADNLEKDKEIDRLNNIINELEEYIKPYLYMLNGIKGRDIYEQCQLDDFTDIMEKLQELKEGKE